MERWQRFLTRGQEVVGRLFRDDQRRNVLCGRYSVIPFSALTQVLRPGEDSSVDLRTLHARSL